MFNEDEALDDFPHVRRWDLLRYSESINIYHKLPKPRDLIKPQPLGSQNIRVIKGYEFREGVNVSLESATVQPLGEIQPKSPTKLQSLCTLFQYYSTKMDKLVYSRSGSVPTSQETFNYVEYSLLRQDRNVKYYTEINESSMSPTPQPSCQLQDSELSFESNFESGNLSMVYKISDSQYDLLLNTDINTTSYTQWFYFKVTRNKLEGPPLPATLRIVNLMKSTSLYTKGMKVLLCSSLENQWKRGGNNITYSRNSFMLQPNSNKTYNTLSFEYVFEPGQSVYFAYSYPYTYSQLNADLDQMETTHLTSRIFSRQVLCMTACGNRCQIVTIGKRPNRGKPTILISARVHPGQTVSSHVLNGIMKFLLSDHAEAVKLRQMYVWKIVPMLNPDGVIHGNYRCNLSGHDLNRKWVNPDPLLHPEIHAYKKYILKLKNQSNIKEMMHHRTVTQNYLTQLDNRSNILMVIDLHGHSTKKNTFIYGCSDQKSQEFPFLLSRLVRGFSFKDCAFEIEQKKQGTARVALWRDLDLPYIYTIESSFCTCDQADFHFKMKHYQDVGQGICQAILLYFSKEQQNVKMKQGFLKQMSNQTANGNPQDSAESEDDSQCKKKLNRPIEVPKRTQNISQIRSVGNTVKKKRPGSPAEKKAEKRYQLQMPKVIDMTSVTPLKSKHEYRKITRERELFRERFAIVAVIDYHGSPKRSISKRVQSKRQQTSTNFVHFPFLKM